MDREKGQIACSMFREWYFKKFDFFFLRVIKVNMMACVKEIVKDVWLGIMDSI